ncbi:hypothetical protein EQG68_13855 [Flavobacterium piscinae]|uniref:Uncharacterized protein n=1 Tax=Flavobacterium piscinae TaxID=2506424 RepID=A0A4V1N3H4_9FLAO|nr:hypothetical protein [Flavobacterium piscinae]RXR28676.1 hypothetical protein EQG68_13855 [Flavobacterium piscinae]
MKLINFLALPEKEQYQTLFESGVVVAERKEKPVIKKLYSLNTFFVEVHLHFGTEEILFKKVFKEGEILDGYLREFKLVLPKIN